MKKSRKLITTAIALLLSMGSVGSQLFARQQNDTMVGKTGKLHIGSSVMVSSTLLKPGMYQVQHVTEGENHLIVFRIIRMGYRDNMGNETLGEEVAREKCRIEPDAQRWKHTKLHVERNNSGQRVVKEVQIAGEDVLHRFDSKS
jgi:hypothetical protein